MLLLVGLRFRCLLPSLHGEMIPLHGAKEGDIEISTLQGEAHRQLRLIVKEAEHDDLLRVVPLPAEAGEIKAHFINGRLHLRW